MIHSAKCILAACMLLFCCCSFPCAAQENEKKLEQVAESNDLMGGALVIFSNNSIQSEKYFGTANLEKGIPVSAKTRFRVASISKTVTSIAIMQLAEKKKLNLDDNIEKILGFPFTNPGFPETAITIRMLLSHTSSLNDDPEAYDGFLQATYERNPVPELSELLALKGKYHSDRIFLSKKPGTFFNYSNLNFGILGTIVEIVSGFRFDEYCQKFILSPLDINGGFNLDNVSDLKNLATLYRKTEGSWQVQFDQYNEDRPVFENIRSYRTGSNAIRFSPQGGLRISAADLAKLFTLFLNRGQYRNNKILSPASVKMMMRSQWAFNGSNGDSNNGLFRSWGLGLQLLTQTRDNDELFGSKSFWAGHAGDAYGLVSDAFIDTIGKRGFVFITNGSGSGYTISDCSSFYKFEKEVFDIVENEMKKIQPAKLPPARKSPGKK